MLDSGAECGFKLQSGDLEANRQGRLSTGQRRRLLTRFLLTFALGIVLIIPFAVVIVYFSVVMDVRSDQRWIVWVTDVILEGVIAWTVYEVWKSFRDVQRGTVREITGKAYTETRIVEDTNYDNNWVDDALGVNTVRRTVYYVQFGAQKFKVSRKIYEYFYSAKPSREKPTFRVYYLPSSRRILGADKLAEAAEPDEAQRQVS